MLAAAGPNGRVRAATVGNLARIANLTIEETTEALAILEAPDPESTTPDHEGRRVLRERGYWLVVNHRRYRDLRTKRQVLDAERKRDERAAKKASPSPDASRTSADKSDASRTSAREAEEDRERERSPSAPGSLPPIAAAGSPSDAPARVEEAAAAAPPEGFSRFERPERPEKPPGARPLAGVVASALSGVSGTPTDRQALLDRTRKLVIREFAARWEQTTQPGLWTQYGSPDVDRLVDWLVSVPGDHVANLAKTLDAFFADEWVASRKCNYSIRHLADHPSKYFAPNLRVVQARTPKSQIEAINVRRVELMTAGDFGAELADLTKQMNSLQAEIDAQEERNAARNRR
jgi:hypothetical protein